MSQRDDYFKSVNWTTGMLLAPEHFQRQDRYVEEQVAWLLKHCIAATGLVGGGVRLASGEQGLAKYDPKLEVLNDAETLKVTVTRARGITAGGDLVEIDEQRAVQGSWRKSDLAGVTDVLVYVVRTGGREPDPASVGNDPANPHQAGLTRAAYEIRLGLPAELAQASLAVGKLRRASETLSFEQDSQYIPPAASLLAHTSLHDAATRLQSEIRLIVGELVEVHRNAARYAERIATRGVDVRGDQDIRAFLERAVLALETCAYETADLTMPPQRFFQQIERAGRMVALSLDLSASSRQFFKELGQVDASYTELLEAEQGALATQRELDRREELRPLVVRASETLGRIRQLAEALAGKYIDYRINRSVESIRFMLDRDGEHFYEAVTAPSHPQRDGDLLTFVFSQLELSGRHEYRVVLTGDPRSSYQWAPGQDLNVTIRVNAQGGGRAPLTRAVLCELEGQRNFAINFDTPGDVATISGLTVTVQPGHGIRGAVLFRRRLGLASVPDAAPAPRPVAPPPSPSPTPAVDPAPSPKPSAPKITLRRPGRSPDK
ncbi:MAG: hypothetical protein R2909_09260 [Gemmatimonadales bacterium]